MAWTNVSKPSTTWTSDNPQGRQVYDESSMTYDDASVFYDGFNPSQYTNVSKPIAPASWISIAKPT